VTLPKSELDKFGPKKKMDDFQAVLLLSTKYYEKAITEAYAMDKQFDFK